MAAHRLTKARAFSLVAIIVLLGLVQRTGLDVAVRKRQLHSSPRDTAARLARRSDQGNQTAIQLYACPPNNTGEAVDEAYISFAFEFDTYPPFAGNASHPNDFSNNLLNNLGNLTGTKPRIRIGGNSADFALYDGSLRNASTPRINTGFKTGVKQEITYGDVYYQSFQNFPDVKYIYQFDMAYIVGGGPNGAQTGYASLNSTVELICKALSGGRLLYWEYGNEPDLYPVYGHNYVSRADWSNQDYVETWENGTAVIRAKLRDTPECAELATDENFKFTGPSLWVPASNDTVTLDGAWNAGLDKTGLIGELAMHRYLQNNKTGGLTYASSLLNHSHAISSLQDTLTPYERLPKGVPRLAITESNSISNIGIPNFTNTFAGALWNMDWALHLASQSIARVHFQQGVGFFYNSWEAVDNAATKKGTKAPYYGNLAAAYAIGESRFSTVQVFEHDLNKSPVDVAYSVYSNGTLKRIAVLNLRTYFNGTRGSQTYTFDVPASSGFDQVTAKRLVGPSTDDLGGVQWDGNQYGLEPNNGLGNSPGNVTTGENIDVRNGQISIDLDDSSAAVLEFSSGPGSGNSTTSAGCPKPSSTGGNNGGSAPTSTGSPSKGAGTVFSWSSTLGLLACVLALISFV